MQNMEKKIRFSEQQTPSKILYGAVIAILIFSAVIVGLVATNNRDGGGGEPPVESGQVQETPNEEQPSVDTEKKPVVYTAPVAGALITEHSLTVPVFSETLGEWRVHTGVDIECAEGTPVYATAAGTVTGVYLDPMMGMTVEITHESDVVSIYSNLERTLPEGIEIGKSVEGGTLIGTVGDTSVRELGKDAHLHFGMRTKGVHVNPLDYFSDEIKKAAFGIDPK